MSRPLDDLEMFELLQLAYPEKFTGDDDETWDAAQDFADNIAGFEDIADLLGRVVMLTHPIRSCMTGRLWHCLGRVAIEGDQVNMIAAVTREIQPTSHGAGVSE